LGKKYGWDNEAMTGNIYPLMHSYLENELSFEEMKEKFTTLDWHLAKRQLTWLRRNPYIYWGDLSEVRNYIVEQLAS
jgi:tRNA dimethylallyltransferase